MIPSSALIAGELQKAQKCYQLGDLIGAESHSRTVLRHDPEQTDALQIGAITAYQRSDHGTAIALVNRAIAIQPSKANLYNTRGNIEIRTSDFTSAEASYLCALKLDDKLADAWFNLGTLYYQQARAAESLPLLGKAIQLNPKVANYWNNLGNAYRKLGSTDEALNAYRGAIALDPTQGDAISN
ncbi:MAG: tetratricopeptide repeat protein, partial [Proteobacteria bacterium]|nr:tetratricopeptide repeat protein [Pseudomonadota bacterium]